MFKHLTIILITLFMTGCGFNTNYISSVPTIGEKVRGPINIIRTQDISIHLAPRNDLITSEYNYVVAPIFPIGGNSDETFAQKQIEGSFVVGLSLFANNKNLAISFSDITLNLKGSTFNIVDVLKNPYANYPDEQSLNVGDKDILCPKSQLVGAELFNQEIELKSEGLWRCYDLVFPVSTPSPRDNFQLSLVIKNLDTGTEKSIMIPFEQSQWGHSDSFP